MSKVLIVDDDKKIGDLLQQYLESQGMKTDVAENASQARLLMDQNNYGLAIVDVMMPGESGIDLTKSIKENKDMPIIMLTALGSVEDRINGLESGADDYLPKPFDPKELFLRAKKLLERSNGTASTIANVSFGKFDFNLETRILSNEEGRISLSSTESDLLHLFCSNINQDVDRYELAEKFNGISERSIDVQVTRLRKKIETDPKNPQFIQTRRGKGYVFRA